MQGTGYRDSLGGGALARQVSVSHVQPRTIEFYQNVFSQTNNGVEGWLHVRKDKSEKWERNWVLFEDKIGIRFSSKQELIHSVFYEVRLNDVISFRQDSNYGENSWLITYRKATKAGMSIKLLYLKADNKDEMNKWLFAYQVSIAQVLTALIDASSKRREAEIDETFGVRSKRNSGASPRSQQLGAVFDFSAWDLTLRSIPSTHRSRTTDYVASSWELADHKSVLDLHKLATEPIPIRNTDTRAEGRDTQRQQLAATPENDFTVDCNNYIRLSQSAPRSSQSNGRAYSSSNFRISVKELSISTESVASSLGNVGPFDSESLLLSEDIDNDIPFFPIEDEERTTQPLGGRTRMLPNVERLAERKKAVRVVCGACSKRGPRDYQEDRYVAITDLDYAMVDAGYISPFHGESSSYFAVYDGHSGSDASSFLESNLHLHICNHARFMEEIEHAIVESCVQIDETFLDICKDTRKYAGTTATGAFIVGSKLTVFNIGDCQAVLSSNGSPRILLQPHKPNREDERSRIGAAGGWITEEKELFMGRLHRMDLSDDFVKEEARKVTWVVNYRVCGELAVSRSIGDPDYKRFIPGAVVNSPYFLWPQGHDSIFHADLVIPDPECITIDISPKDEFLILASDGLWDVVSAEDAVGFVKKNLAIGKTAKEAADELCELALRLGSGDNVTVVIALFDHVDNGGQGQFD